MKFLEMVKFFIHNRIENINEVGSMLQSLFPNSKIRIDMEKWRVKN